MNPSNQLFRLTLIVIAAASAHVQAQSASTTGDGEATPPYGASTYQDDARYPAPGDGYYSARPIRGEQATGWQPKYDPQGQYRQPTSMVFVDERRALITTKISGQVFCLDLPDRQLSVVLEKPEFSFGAIAKLADDCVAIAEQHGEQVLIVTRQANTWRIVARLSTPGQPNRLLWDPERRTLVASGLWSQRLYRWRAESKIFKRWSARQQVDLPMCGGELLLIPAQQTILCTDAFGREYVAVDRDAFRIMHRAQLYGHNISGLALTDDSQFVFFPHQLLNEFIPTVRTDITWGGLMSNNLRWLRTDRLLHATGVEVFKQGHFYPLGAPGNGAGDPSSLAVSSQGRLAVTLGGTNRLAVGSREDYYFEQYETGLHPVDCAFSPDDRLVVAVNQFSDSLTIVDLENDQVQHLSLGPTRAPTEVERGEIAFFSSRLSHDGWMSCHSCHSQGHSNGQLNDNFTDHSFGTPKRILSLRGQAETQPYAWDGSMPTLEGQVKHSIASTMASNQSVDESQVRAIAAFVRTLPEPPGLASARMEPGLREPASSSSIAASQETVHGQQLFRQLNCVDCHAGRQLTSADTFDVGIPDEDALVKFNPPSLIGVSQRTGALFHDGRAKTLRDVLRVQQHQLPRALDEAETTALIRYLESL